MSGGPGGGRVFSLSHGRGRKSGKKAAWKKFCWVHPNVQLLPPGREGVRRDEVAKTKTLPDREQVIRQMWKLANAGAGDAVELACFPPGRLAEIATGKGDRK